MKLNIDSEKILKAAETCPAATKTLEILFPEVFIKDKDFVNIGQLLVRPRCPGNIYAIQEVGGYIRLLNITYSTFWRDSSPLHIGNLKDPNKKSITLREFEVLAKYNASEFKVTEFN